MQFSIFATAFFALGTSAAAVAAPASVPAEIEARATCPKYTNEVSNQPWVCCVYDYEYDQCCNKEASPTGLDTSYFRSCAQFVADGANNY